MSTNAKTTSMTGRGKTPPKGEARPLGTKRPKAAPMAASRSPRGKTMAEKLAGLPDAEPEVRETLDEAIQGAQVVRPDPFLEGIEQHQVPAWARRNLGTQERPAEDFSASTHNSLDTSAASGVSSPQHVAITPSNAPASEPGTENKAMTLTFKNLSKNGKNAFYAGAAVALRIPLSAFPDKQHPATIEVIDGAFAPAKAAKVKMTAAERKAANAAKPKPTLAERIQRREEALAKDKAKLAAAANQPSL